MPGGVLRVAQVCATAGIVLTDRDRSAWVISAEGSSPGRLGYCCGHSAAAGGCGWSSLREQSGCSCALTLRAAGGRGAAAAAAGLTDLACSGADPWLLLDPAAFGLEEAPGIN